MSGKVCACIALVIEAGCFSMLRSAIRALNRDIKVQDVLTGFQFGVHRDGRFIFNVSVGHAKNGERASHAVTQITAAPVNAILHEIEAACMPVARPSR